MLLQKQTTRMAFGANEIADKRIARDRLLSLEIRLSDIFLYVNLVPIKQYNFIKTFKGILH